MTSLIQRSLAGGEISPQLAARADLVKYSNGLRRCRNFLVQRFGSVTNRPGTKYVAEVKDSTQATRLLRFVFNDAQTYVLEVGDRYIRWHRSGAPLTVSGVAAYNGATTYAVGDLVTQGGVTYYCIAATTAHAPPNATYWYALTGSVYEIPTPYLAADLAGLRVAQSNDVLFITHPSYPPKKLQRFGNTKWTLVDLVTAPSIVAPSISTGAAGVAGTSQVYTYVISSVTASGEESLGSAPYSITCSVPTVSNPNRVYWYRAIGDDGKPAASYNVYRRTNGINAFIGVAADYTANHTLAAGNNIGNSTIVVSSGIAIDTPQSGNIVIAGTEYTYSSWAASTFTISGTLTASYAAGTAASLHARQFNDVNFEPVTTVTPPTASTPFDAAGKYPACVGFYQQRLVLGGSNTKPQTVYASAPPRSKTTTPSPSPSPGGRRTACST